MPAQERSRRARGLVEIVTSRDPGDWIDEQLADIKAKRAAAGRSLRPEQTSADATGVAKTVHAAVVSSPRAEPRSPVMIRRRAASAFP